MRFKMFEIGSWYLGIVLETPFQWITFVLWYFGIIIATSMILYGVDRLAKKLTCKFSKKDKSIMSIEKEENG